MSNLGQQIKKIVNKRSNEEELEKAQKKKKIEDHEDESDEDSGEENEAMGYDTGDESSDDEIDITEMGDISEEEEDNGENKVVKKEADSPQEKNEEEAMEAVSNEPPQVNENVVEEAPSKKQINKEKLALMIKELGDKETNRLYNTFARKHLGPLEIPYAPRNKKEAKRYKNVVWAVNRLPTNKRLATAVVRHLRHRGADLLAEEADCNDDLEAVFMELKIPTDLKNYFYLYVERMQGVVKEMISHNLKTFKKTYTFTDDE